MPRALAGSDGWEILGLLMYDMIVSCGWVSVACR
jgi:hypothetical protein